MSDFYVLDRLLLKPVKVSSKNDTVFPPKTRVIYQDEEWKEAAGTVLWYETPCNKTWTFIRELTGNEKDLFDQHQKKAADLYKIFKALFTAEFQEAVPICARMHHQWTQIYFYFFAETRFQFGEFVKSFRQQIGYNFFLYQVSARDRVRLNPHLDEWFDPSGMPLMYHIFKHPLPHVESDMLVSQWLDWRAAEKMKDWSWKYDHSLLFEADRYNEESKKYPQRWSIITRQGKQRKCMWYNLLTQEIKIRGKSDDDTGWSDRRGEWKKIFFDELQNKTNAS